MRAIEHRKVRGMANRRDERAQIGQRQVVEGAAPDKDLPEFEEPPADTVTPGRRVHLQVATRPERCSQPRGNALVHGQKLCQLGHAQFRPVKRKAVENVERFVDGFDCPQTSLR